MLRGWLGRGDGTLVDLLHARVQAAPQAPLLVDEHRRVSNEMALDEAQCIAHLLRRETGSRPGCPVASFLSNRVEEHLWRLGVNLGGHIHVSLNREYRGHSLRDVLVRSDASWLVTERAAWPELSAIVRDVKPFFVAFVDEIPAEFPVEWGIKAFDRTAWTGQARWSGVRPDAGDCASILFTSGTTGRPKAVRLPHNMFVRGGAYLASAWGMGPQDVFHAWSPAYHIGGQLYLFGVALVSGASCAVFPSFSRSRFWEQVDRFGCTFTAGFANIATYLLSAPPAEQDRHHGLRMALFAGLSPEVREAFEGRFGVRCVDSYGMTEVEPVACSVPGVTPVGSCGPVNPDFSVRLVDGDGRDVPTGGVGRVLIRPRHRAAMMLGYGESPGSDGASRPGAALADDWFATHDLARFDSGGNFHFVSREKTALKRRGENVSPREVELAILGHPGVKECAVVGVWLEGSTEPEIKAVIVPAPGHALRAADIAAYCGSQLPRYMRPRYIEFVGELRYTEVGKLDAAALSELGPAVWDAARAVPG